jgi:hypothetical protein
MQAPFDRKRVTKQELRQIFNSQNFWERVCSGELYAQVESQKHPCPIEANQPLCTWSQIVSYSDSNNQEVARVHQYKHPDGSIGASGRPDPVRILVDGIIYSLERKQRMK